MHIKAPVHTVFLLVGPSLSGKSTFAAKLAEKLKTYATNTSGLSINASVLSSDAYRYELLGNPSTPRHGPSMLEVSTQAFKRLMTDFENVTSFPVNHDFVIVDTTGLNQGFREAIVTKARENEYQIHLVTFEYDKLLALEGVPDNHKKVVGQQVNRMKREVLPSIKRSLYNASTKIRQRNQDWWGSLVVEIPNLQLLDKCYQAVGEDQPVAVIGDSHEHVEALTQMVTLLEEKYPGVKIVHVGDYLDKGRQTEAMVNYAHARAKKGDIFVHGNHENYAVKRLRGELNEKSIDPELEKTYMTSVPVLLERTDLAEKVLDIWDNHSVPFLVIQSYFQRTLFITHAPCKNKVLGKLSNFALKDQRNLYTKDRDADYRTSYPFVFDEAEVCHPFHIFGHVAHSAPKMIYKNKVFLDTGAVYGNKLSAFVIVNNDWNIEQIQTTALDTSKTLEKNATTPIVPDREFSIKDYNLSEEDHRFVRRVIRNNVQFLSGTMAPSPSWDGQLEPLSSALEYYRKRGITDLIIEPKYMGSRAQFYLFRGKPEESYVTSRNGFKISEDYCPGISALVASELTKFEANEKLGEWQSMIIDGELMPWGALGGYLIENEFGAYHALIDYELNQLSDDVYTNFAPNTFPVKVDVEARSTDLALFKENLDLYTASGELSFKPFKVLRIDADSSVLYKSEAEMFPKITDDEYLIINSTDDSSLEAATLFFNSITVDKKMEGVVVKPIRLSEAELARIVPYMKVRNENYLTLMYGYDYKQRYEQLVSEKNISGKTNMSLTEWELGRSMLTAEGDYHKELVVKMISNISKEKALDPRL
jgi:predicted kinase